MKPDLIEKLEDLLEQAIAHALDFKKLKKLPVKPRTEITHLMAKTVVAVYGGVVEGRQGYTNPSLTAHTAAIVRSFNAIFRRMAWTCSLIVSTLISRLRAISSFDSPCPTCRRT